MASKGKTITGNVIKLKRVRLSFPTLHEAQAPKNHPTAEKAFSGTALLDPTNPLHRASIQEMSAEIKRLRAEAWGQGGKPHPKEEKLECFGKGDLKTNDEGEIYKGYEGMYFVSGKNKNRPLALLPGKRELNDPKVIEQTFYGGCYVDMNVNFWVQNNDFGKAIRCGIRGVMFIEDGEAFGGGRASSDEFDDYEESDGLDGLDDEWNDDILF